MSMPPGTPWIRLRPNVSQGPAIRRVVAPSVVGHGRRVFEGDDVQSWKLLEVGQGKNGTLFLDYSR